MSYRLGIDVGGTFTDFTFLGDHGDLSISKVLSDRSNVAGVILAGLEEIAKKQGKSSDELLNDIELIVHGTTIATNALIQQKMARTGLITTSGFRDILELREGLKENQTAEAVARAPIQRTQLFERVQELFQDADIIASPTLAAPPVPFDQNPLEPLVVDGREIGTLRDEWTPYGGVFNQTGHPAISIPAGFTSDGLPVGIQIAGRYNTEQLLLDLAAAMEQETKWPESWPKI